MPSRCRPLLGTFVEVSADDERAIDAAFTAVETVHRLMSAHEPDSDVSRINRFAHVRPVKVHEWTRRVIERAFFWAKCSEGAFDVVRAGKAALLRGLLPRHADQPQPEAAAHWTWLEVQGGSVRLLKPACIDVGGIAKGFAVDRAVEVLREAGCESGLVNAGGDLRAFGRELLPVTIIHPLSRRQVIASHLKNEAMATSAGLPDDEGQLSFDHLGARNPRWVSISVVAPNACDADALTKAIWNAPRDAYALLAEVGARALALSRDGRVDALRETARVSA
jgi:thiamine biosynthesis lipoprotein